MLPLFISLSVQCVTIKDFFSKWAWPRLGNLFYMKPDLNGRLRDSYPIYYVRFSFYITTIIKPKKLHFVSLTFKKKRKKVCVSVIWIYKLEAPNGGNMDYSLSVTIRLLSHVSLGYDSQIHVYDGLQAQQWFGKQIKTTAFTRNSYWLDFYLFNLSDSKRRFCYILFNFECQFETWTDDDVRSSSKICFVRWNMTIWRLAAVKLCKL